MASVSLNFKVLNIKYFSKYKMQTKFIVRLILFLCDPSYVENGTLIRSPWTQRQPLFSSFYLSCHIAVSLPSVTSVIKDMHIRPHDDISIRFLFMVNMC